MANLVGYMQYKFQNDAGCPDSLVHYPWFTSTDFPYSYFFQVGDPLDAEFLCDSSGGEAVFTFGYVSRDKADGIETSVSWLEYLPTIIGTYDGLSVRHCYVSGLRDLPTEKDADMNIYHRQWEATITWGK